MNILNVIGFSINIVFLLLGIIIGYHLKEWMVHRAAKRAYQKALKDVGGSAAELKRQGKAKRIAHLLALYLLGKISQEEHDELDEWVGANDRNMELFATLTDDKNISAALDYLENIKNSK